MELPGAPRLVGVPLLAQVFQEAGSPNQERNCSHFLPTPASFGFFSVSTWWSSMLGKTAPMVTSERSCLNKRPSRPPELPTHSVNLIQNLPLLVGHPQRFRSLDGPLQLAGPHLEIRYLLFLQKLSESLGKLGFEIKVSREETRTHTYTCSLNLGGHCA